MSHDRMQLVSASESASRAAKLLPTKGSEDRRDLLVVPDLESRDEDDDAAAEESPENPLGWTLYLQFPKATGISSIVERLTYDWRWNRNRPDMWGRLTGAPWTHLAECAGTESFTEMAVTWSLFDDRQGWQIPTTVMLDRFRLDLEKEMAPLGGKVVAQPVSSQYAAEEVPKKIKAADRRVMIAVNAPEGQLLEGRDIWDVMLSLGLEWGDMDLFHFTTEEGDSLFEVWTTTEPGYFLPEVIAAGKLQTHDLVFEFSLPLCPAPEAIFESMLKAATYAQQRLGGLLVNGKREPFDEATARKELEEGIAVLRQLGVEPGSQRATKLLAGIR